MEIASQAGTAADLLGTTGRLEAVRLRSANGRILRALLSLGSANLLIRATGVVMQVVVTARFGIGPAMDAYLVAQAVPVLLADVLANATGSSVTPTFARLYAAHRREQIAQLFSTLLNVTLLGAGLATVALLLLRQQVVFLVAPNLDPARATLAGNLALIVYPTLVLLATLTFLEAILNAAGQFGWPAYAGLLGPLSIAACALVAGRSLGIAALAIGSLIGLALQGGVFVVRLRRARLAYRPIIDWRNPALRTIGTLAGLGVLGASISQISPVIDQIFASSLSSGSISALSYAGKLVGVPTGVVFIAVGRAALPYLSRQVGIGDLAAFKRTLRLYIWLVGLGTIALDVVMLAGAPLIVRILFQRGAFSAAATGLTAYTLRGLLIGLVPMALGFLLAEAFIALGRMRTLVYVSAFSAVANAVFDAILARLWQSFGIALATSAVYTCTLILLVVALRRSVGPLDLLTPPPELLRNVRRARTGPFGRSAARWGDAAARAWRAARTPEARLRGGLFAAAVLAAAAAGGAIAQRDPLASLRVVVGVPLVLLLLRYRFALLVAWASAGALVGSTLPLFNGNNFDTALTVATLVALCFVAPTRAFGRLPALALLAVYLLWVGAGIDLSPLDSITFLKEWAVMVNFAAVAVLTIGVLTTRARLLLLVDVILAVAAFVALYGIFGYFTHQNVLVDSSTGEARITSVFGYAPPFALYLTTVLPLVLYRVYTARRLGRVLAASLIPVLLAALILTFTRGALISVPICCLALALFVPSRAAKLGVLGATLGAAALSLLLEAVGGLPIFDRFFQTDLGTLNGRTYLWRALLERFDPSRLRGYGLHASDAVLNGLHLGTDGQIGNGLIATSPSNLFVGTLYDHGVIGLVLLLAVFAALAVSLLTGARRARGEQRVLFAIALVVLVNGLVQSIDVNDLWTQGIGIYFWIIVALPFAACWSSREPSPSPMAATGEPAAATPERAAAAAR